jgi:hypothetical protein
VHDTRSTERKTLPSAPERATEVLERNEPAQVLSTPHGLLQELSLKERSTRPAQYAAIYRLQRAQGNRVVARMLQRTTNQINRAQQVESGSISETGAVDADRADALLQEALAIIETALMAVSGTDGAAAAAGASAQAEVQPVSESTAEQSQPAVSSVTPLTQEQADQLRVAQRELLALQGGSPEMIAAACLPILQGARGVQPGGSESDSAEGTISSEGTIQRSPTLVMGAPLLAGGPPGWAIYAGLALTTLVIGGIIASEMSRPRERTWERVEPRTMPRTREPERRVHMGNIHVQGDDIGGSAPNFPWNRPTPMTKAEALAGLAALRGMLSPRQLSYRDTAFIRAAAFITSTSHTAPPPLFRTFQNPQVIRDQRFGTRRVDVEIIRGTAFV